MFFSRDKSQDQNPRLSWLAFMLMPIRMRDSYDRLYERLLKAEMHREELLRSEIVRECSMLLKVGSPSMFTLTNEDTQRKVVILMGNDGVEIDRVSNDENSRMFVPFEQWVHLKEALDWLIAS